MKQFVCLIGAVGLFVSSFAQPTNLFITTQKTSSLLFPYPIKHVDRGTKDILVEPVKEANNILLVKAASSNFTKTNLSVITADGSVYTFDVQYGEPSLFVYRVPPANKPSLSTYANSILDNPKTIRGIQRGSWGIIARVIGLYVKEEVLYYQLQLVNQSSLDYDIDFLHFYIRDRKTAKRTPMQEVELTPLYIAGNPSKVKANSQTTIVVALESFTLPDAKFLAIEIGEKNGGRSLLMKVGNRKIVKASVLPDVH